MTATSRAHGITASISARKRSRRVGLALACHARDPNDRLLEGLALPEVEEGRLDVVLIAEVGHRDFVGQMPTQNRGLLLRRQLPVALPCFPFDELMDSSESPLQSVGA
jgi:hypothetical protein